MFFKSTPAVPFATLVLLVSSSVNGLITREGWVDKRCPSYDVSTGRWTNPLTATADTLFQIAGQNWYCSPQKNVKFGTCHGSSTTASDQTQLHVDYTVKDASTPGDQIYTFSGAHVTYVRFLLSRVAED